MATPQTNPLLVPPKWQGAGLVVFLAIAAWGAITGNIPMIVTGGVLALVAMVINRLIRVVFKGAEFEFSPPIGPGSGSVPSSGDFTDTEPKGLPEGDPAQKDSANTPTLGSADDD